MIYLEVHPSYTYVYNASPDVIVAIQAQTFYLVPGYEEDVRYLTGVWDGKEQLFQPHVDALGRPCYRMMTGLLQRVLNVLVARGAAHQIVPVVAAWTPNPALAYLNDKPLSMRPYQTAAVMSLLANPLPRKGGVLQAATGAGKTRMAAKTIQIVRDYTVFLVNAKDLQAQTIREFEEMLGCKVGQVGGGKHDIQDITVATIQTVALAAGCADPSMVGSREIDPTKAAEVLWLMQRAKLVIVDECHGVAARTARAAVLSATNANFVVGLSASPWRDDGMDILIEAACGHTTYKVNASTLIELGFLVRPDICIHEMPMPANWMLRSNDAMEFHKLYKDWVVTDDLRNQYICAIVKDHLARGEQVGIVLVKYVEHGELLSQMIPHSTFMHGKLSNKRRKEILDNVKSGETRVLIATSLADQGLDVPIASFLVLAGGGKSSTKALQRIGRVLRTHEGKTRAYVHDIVDQHANLQRHYRERLRIYKTEPAFRIHHHQVH